MMTIRSISARIILIYNHLECGHLHDDDDDDTFHLHKNHPHNHLECEHLHDDDDDDDVLHIITLNVTTSIQFAIFSRSERMSAKHLVPNTFLITNINKNIKNKIANTI